MSTAQTASAAVARFQAAVDQERARPFGLSPAVVLATQLERWCALLDDDAELGTVTRALQKAWLEAHLSREGRP